MHIQSESRHSAKSQRIASHSDGAAHATSSNVSGSPKISRPSVEVDAKPSLDNSPSDSTNFWQLLDFSALTSQSDILARFEDVANALLCEFHIVLVRGGIQTEYEILELEFYLQKSGCHEDPFTHGSEEQERSGQWYFHRAPKRGGSQPALSATVAGGYRGGTRKGMDLTLGGPVTSKYFAGEGKASSTSATVLRGGALLRTLRRLSDGKVISGPSLLVDEILRASGASNINDLVTAKWNGDISASAPSTNGRAVSMSLRMKSPSTSTKKPRVFCSPRIGLDLSNLETSKSVTHPRVVFVGKPYRYFTHPHLLTANGRSQTFVGIYRASEHLDNESRLKKELCALTGIKEQTVAKYLSDYRLGYDEGNLASFVGPAGKGVCASTSMYLKMMGVLERLQEESE
ncbi:hypothetical protein BV22DRAFT_1076286 [Leucogyrophana mollusca]|uniref:Uncharacterized protein n=1 Tax=Leucogyrophana mollusca TaxID=85980 RepID=A0ACB8AXU5_9AGAM|nr:hypothetical protein BV22DRAFT_1076286 [Leucogyrophana mollusca]